MTAARLHVTKLAAAQRQLRAAIRIFFDGEDELAVHTVASAAYKIIADLKAERGRDEVADFHLTTIFYIVRDYRRGTLPPRFTNDPEAMKWIKDMAEKLPITADMKAEEVKVTVSPETARKWWMKRNKAANFLKHADRDPRAHISLDDIDNLELLTQALASYTDLVKDDLGNEGFVLWVYFSVVHETHDDLPKEYREMALRLSQLAPKERLAFCSHVLRELRDK
ncbi:MAG: hypothetical protein ACREXU_15660 [Gammaproteobacteria bacterium]